MLRQVWIYMLPEDEEELLGRLTKEHGLNSLFGRFFRGTTEQLRQSPESLETRELKAAERWVHLIHPAASRELVVHELTEGPFAGWSRLDEVRSEVISLVRPAVDQQGLAPGHLQANTHAWFGGAKLRKSPEFTQWAAECMRLVETYAETGFDWIRVAPAARAWAEAGGRLHYLYKQVPLHSETGTTPVSRPHASLRG